MKKEKKISVLMVVTTAIFVMCIIGATYAYLAAKITSSTTESDIETLTNTTDSLEFSITGDVSMRANLENFAQDKGNLSSTVKAKATLLANNKTNVSLMNYTTYISINENDFEYTTADNKPEILLEVTDPEGNEITEIKGLDYVIYKEEVRDAETNEVTQAKVAGFDVTTKKGIYVVSYAKEIEVTSDNENHLIEQEWQIKAILVNLETNQEANARKVFDVDVHMEKGMTLVNYLKAEVYKTDSTLLLHDATLTNGAGDNNYRYSGPNASVNNYVCFGSDAENCPSNNLYRIIGIFGNQVKLIKNTSYGNYNMVDGNGYGNVWSSTTLCTTLNENYYKSFKDKWQNMITKSSWKIGKVNSGADINVKGFYDKESGSYSNYIGLMYPSDYGYAASPSSWTIKLSNYNNVISNNWLYLGADEWTIITYDTGLYGRTYNILNTGTAGISYSKYGSGIRPSFYLNSNVKVLRGNGTSSNPYRLA